MRLGSNPTEIQHSAFNVTQFIGFGSRKLSNKGNRFKSKMVSSKNSLHDIKQGSKNTKTPSKRRRILDLSNTITNQPYNSSLSKVPSIFDPIKFKSKNGKVLKFINFSEISI